MFLKRKPHAKHEAQAAPADGQTPGDAEMPTPESATPEAELSPADIAQLQAKAAEAEDWHTKYLYAMAELDNFRKRTAKERRDLINYAGQEILFDLLEVLDNFDRALEADRKESNPAVIVEGIEMIRKQLARLLDKFGVKPVEALGSKFDPKVHEALQHVPTPDAQPGTVVHELQKGYVLRDRVLRPARVVVASEMSDTSDESVKPDTVD